MTYTSKTGRSTRAAVDPSLDDRSGLVQTGTVDPLSTRVVEAQAAKQSFLEIFGAMLQDDLGRHCSPLTGRRFKRSGLAARVSLIMAWKR